MTGKAFRIWRLTRDIPAWEVAKALDIHPSLLRKVERERITLNNELELRIKKFMEKWSEK